MIKLLSLISFINYFSPIYTNKTYDINIYDNFFALEHLLHGDLTNLEDLFMPDLDSEYDGAGDEDEEKLERELDLRKDNLYQWEDFQYLTPKLMTADVAEYNNITKILKNVTESVETRRGWKGWWRGWSDPEDWYRLQKNMEYVKKERFMRMHLQWIIHTRYQVNKALLLKEEKRADKRYKIGYLMSRLRIIKREQQKITTFVWEQDDTDFRGLDSLLRMYEKMVRHDVDMKDTVNFMKALHKEPFSPRSPPITEKSAYGK